MRREEHAEKKKQKTKKKQQQQQTNKWRILRPNFIDIFQGYIGFINNMIIVMYDWN